MSIFDHAEKDNMVIFDIEVLVKPDCIRIDPNTRYPNHSTRGDLLRILRDLGDALELDDPSIASWWNIRRWSKDESWEII